MVNRRAFHLCLLYWDIFQAPFSSIPAYNDCSHFSRWQTTTARGVLYAPWPDLAAYLQWKNQTFPAAPPIVPNIWVLQAYLRVLPQWRSTAGEALTASHSNCGPVHQE